MGLDRRRVSGKVYNGSTLIVPGQQVSSVKVIPITFQYKKGSSRDLEREYQEIKPTTTPTPTVTPTPTPTPVPPEVLLNAIITDNQEYINVGNNYYLQYAE
jgi:hypothetical protein